MTCRTKEAHIAGRSEATAFGFAVVLRLATLSRSMKRQGLPMVGKGFLGDDMIGVFNGES
jgi:hypothetical protein